AQEAARTPPPGAVQTPSKAQRILLVEDSPDVAESFAALLRMMGHKVQVAPNGDTGLEAARTFRPNVAFLDIGLPGMDGYELAQRLRSEYADTLPLVALTGYGQEEDRQRAREAGFDYHLLKPVRIEELEQVLNTLSAAA
ncbi:MAG: response regulator, partial [Gammaproteobacteria bacterium]